MQHVRLIIFLSFFLFITSLPQEEFIKQTPLYLQEIPKTIYDLIKNQQLQQPMQAIAQLPTFSESDIEEMKLVFASAPQEAQCIVKHLQDPAFFELTQDYRSATFVGEPGTGKTTTALAIAHVMIEHGWTYKFLSSISLLGEHRNQTAINLQKELGIIESSKKPTILIIDELNRLLENTDSKHHDTDTTATALWTFLDKQKNNKNFFFIGIMNRANKLPKPYKSRILFDCIKFSLIDNAKTKSSFIRKFLTTKNSMLDVEVTDTFLERELEKIGSCSGRDLKNISHAIYRINKMNDTEPSSPMVIKTAVITYAIDFYLKNKTELDYDAQEETDEQRQNRYHKENQEMQERHFVQQQMIQMATHDHQYVDTSSSKQAHHHISDEGKEEINALISDEQKQLYSDMMKKTRARKAKEAAERRAAEIAAAEIAAAEKRKNSWFQW